MCPVKFPDRVEELYQEHAGSVLSYLTRRCPPDTAHDLLQEIFLQVLRHRERTESVITPRAWLFGVARNVLARHYRDREILHEAVTSELEAPAEREDARLPVMREAILRLPEEMRETLELRLSQELSYEEIAAVLEIPLGTVRSRLHAAVRRLREALTETNSKL